MSFEELQKEWQSHDHSEKLNVATELLLKEVRRNHRQFESTIFWRDIRDGGAAAIVACLSLRVAISRQDWSWYLLAFLTAYCGLFLLIDRWKQRSRRPKSDGSFEATIQLSLFEINHQIWLLKNVFWWGLMPIIIGWAAPVFKAMWQKPIEEMTWHIVMSVYVVLCFLFFYFIYWLNQRAVKTDLEPRRDELETMLASLKQ
jgi:hypothetical protein